MISGEVHSLEIWGVVFRPTLCRSSIGDSLAVTNQAVMKHFTPFGYGPAANDNEGDVA